MSKRNVQSHFFVFETKVQLLGLIYMMIFGKGVRECVLFFIAFLPVDLEMLMLL